MNFKEMVATDLDNVFLNPNEFGEEHEVEGSIVICIIDNDLLQKKQEGTYYVLTDAEKRLLAKSEDLPSSKGYGDTLMVDGIPYIVQSWEEDMGLTTVTLGITCR